MSLSKAFADIIFNILEGNSSIDVENSEILCNAIKEFLGRRTTEECWKLIPDAHQATLLESLGLVKSRTNSATRRIHSTLRQEIAECVKLSDKYIMDHFESLNPEISKDLHRFVAAIRGFQFTIMMSDNYYPTPWSLDPNIFGDPTSRMSRFSRLHEGTKKLKAGSWAWRLALLCFNHEVEYNFSAMLLHEETDTRNFEGIIYEKIAESFNMSTKYFKRRRNTAVFYTKLLVQAGPGSILMIGENSNHLWQESITLDEIDKIVNFIKDQLPKCYHRIKSFDQTAAEMIVSGLCAYGWTLAELRQTQSSLLSELRKHIDFEKCEDNSLREMRHTDATSVVHRNNENAESTPEPRAKRRREDMISVVHQNNKRAEPEPEPMAKRQKGTVKKNMACDYCHRKKTKCDENRPCNSCLCAGLPCEYVRYHLNRPRKACACRLCTETLVVLPEQKSSIICNREAMYTDVCNDSTSQGSSDYSITPIGNESTDSDPGKSTRQTYSHLGAAVALWWQIP